MLSAPARIGGSAAGIAAVAAAALPLGCAVRRSRPRRPALAQQRASGRGLRRSRRAGSRRPWSTSRPARTWPRRPGSPRRRRRRSSRRARRSRSSSRSSSTATGSSRSSSHGATSRWARASSIDPAGLRGHQQPRHRRRRRDHRHLQRRQRVPGEADRPRHQDRSGPAQDRAAGAVPLRRAGPTATISGSATG